ncbi:MAG: hypothetical protein HQK51_09000 [Oligoflexia bacterium]|nr:hypothetical protein [Oligoflexia bacterium]
MQYSDNKNTSCKREEKSNFSTLFSSLLESVKKTILVGKKMISASYTTSCLNKAYQELGLLLIDAMKRKEISWDNPHVCEIVKNIDRYNIDLHVFEEQIRRIKSGSAKGL